MGLQIELSTIRISRRSISIVDYGPIRNPTTNLNWRSQFWYKIDLFRSKFDINRSLSIYFRLKDWKRPNNCRLFNQKGRLINRKQQIISKTTNSIENDGQNDKNTFIFNHFRSNSTNFRYKSNYFRYKWSGIKLNRRNE